MQTLAQISVRFAHVQTACRGGPQGRGQRGDRQPGAEREAGRLEATRQAVLTALDVLGYERPTKLRGERARLVGLVLPELQNPIFPAFAEVVGGALAQQGFTPVLCTQTAGGVTEADYVDLLLQQQVSGVIFAGRPVRAAGRTPRPLPPAVRAQASHGPGQRGHRRARVPARRVRRRGGGRAGHGPPALARPHEDRPRARTPRPRALQPQAGRCSRRCREGGHPAGAVAGRALDVLA